MASIRSRSFTGAASGRPGALSQEPPPPPLSFKSRAPGEAAHAKTPVRRRSSMVFKPSLNLLVTQTPLSTL
eukprot:304186-Chlamydomonas_euryale.AAC.1